MVEKSTEKEPRKRYPDMAAMLTNLEAALEVEIARAGGSGTGEATAVLRSVPERRRRFLTRRHVSIAGVVLILLAGAAALTIAAVTGEEGPSREEPEDGAAAPIELAAVNDFDPEGTSGEHGSEVGVATDGNPSGTSWTTETYTSGPEVTATGKSGVGIYVDAGEPVEATRDDSSAHPPRAGARHLRDKHFPTTR